MNSDRLITRPAAIIAAGLSNKWSNAYSFLGVTFGTSASENGVSFNSLNGNQFQLDVAYYLEPEDLYFLLLQLKDAYVTMTKGAVTLMLTDENIKQILRHKWAKGITQLPYTNLGSISVSGENVTWTFNSVANPALIEIERYKADVILTNYLENYFTKISSSASYPNVVQTYMMNWDNIKSRFNYRMETNL